MTIKVIFGKPGSGKSYHATKTLANILCDWARYEQQNGERFAQRLLTNLPLNRDELKKYVEKRVPGFTFDVDYYVVELTDEFFKAPEQIFDENGNAVLDARGKPTFRFWWDQFPENSLIYLDEMHRFMGSEFGLVSSVVETAALRNYVAQHRHHRHDFVFITQDLSQISAAVVKMVEQVLNVYNAKSMTLPYPLSIPLADVETLLKGFGVSRQVYRVKVGSYVGRRVVYDGETIPCVMEPDVFALYTSNTLASEKTDIVGDRALPFKTRTGAVIWFARKHAPRLTSRFLCWGIGLYCCYGFVFDVLPTSVMGAFTPSTSATANAENVPENDAETSAEPNVSLRDILSEGLPEENSVKNDETTTFDGAELSELPINDIELAPEIPIENIAPISRPSTVDVSFNARGFFTDRIIADDGTTYRIGEEIELGEKDDGTSICEKLESVDIRRREISFESGRVWSRKGFKPPFLSTETDETQRVDSADISADDNNGAELQGALLSSVSESGPDDVRSEGSETNGGTEDAAGESADVQF